MASLNSDIFPYALLIIGGIIFVFGIVGIIYLCVSWSKYKSFKSYAQTSYVTSTNPPRYEETYVEPNLKEYETQVLQMCIPVDDQDNFDLQLDFSNKNHAFNLDNVTYISKDNNFKCYWFLFLYICKVLLFIFFE